MSLQNFIPTVWAANLISVLKKEQVFANFATREYEGEIKGAGDTVVISGIGKVAVAAYVKNVTAITPQELSDASSKLLIDQSPYFAFKIDDVDAAQSKPKVMQEAMSSAAYELKDTQDAYIAGLYAQAGLSQNSNASPADITSLNVEEEFLAAAETMDNAGVPRSNRFAVIPPWIQSKLWLAGVSIITDNAALYSNGVVGRGIGFDFSVSPNVSKNSASWDKSRIICGVRNFSIALAEQVVKTEAYRPEASFSDAVKGLHVYGAKIIRPDATLTLYADKTAEA